jgi:hypothetical protein
MPMPTNRSFTASLAARSHSTALACVFVFGLLLAAGCNPSATHTSDPRLKQIDQLLNEQLPPGTPMSRVSFFLNTRGYQAEPSPPRTVVATVEHVDTKTLRPSAARVTFHFDANNKLLTYEMAPAEPTAVHP